MAQISVRDLSDEVLHCKDFGHRWDTISPLTRRRAPWGTRRVNRCDSCESDRIEIVNSDGWVDPTTRSYDHSPQYEMAKGFDRSDCRAERLRRERERLAGKHVPKRRRLRVV